MQQNDGHIGNIQSKSQLFKQHQTEMRHATMLLAFLASGLPSQVAALSAGA